MNTRAAEHVARITTSLRTENELTADDGQKADGELQSDASATLPCKRGSEDLSGNGPRATAGAAGGVTLGTEKERWFVTAPHDRGCTSPQPNKKEG